MKKCINCVWVGEKTIGPLEHCPVCGDNTKGEVKPEPKSKKEKKDAGVLDINKDGKVDSKDVSSLIAKITGRGRKKSKKGAKK